MNLDIPFQFMGSNDKLQNDNNAYIIIPSTKNINNFEFNTFDK